MEVCDCVCERESAYVPLLLAWPRPTAGLVQRIEERTDQPDMYESGSYPSLYFYYRVGVPRGLGDSDHVQNLCKPIGVYVRSAITARNLALRRRFILSTIDCGQRPT